MSLAMITPAEKTVRQQEVVCEGFEGFDQPSDSVQAFVGTLMTSESGMACHCLVTRARVKHPST